MNHRKLTMLGAVAVTITLAGCATPTALDSDYGNAVRHARETSRANPAAPSNPGAVVEGGDAQALTSSVENMRKDATKAENDVGKGIVINLGSQGGS